MPAGAPTDYTPELAAEICTRIASGLSLRTICQADDMPTDRAVYLWLARHPEFVQQYTRAREQQMEAMAEEILDIADGSNREDANWARLRVDSRKWLMSKMAPKKYGERQTLEHQGGDPAKPIVVYSTGVPRASDDVPSGD